MSDPRAAQVSLELLPGSEPMQGRVSHGEEVWPFTGWLAFAHAIDEVRRSIDRAAHGPSRADDDVPS